jgi:hypothetical protein
VIDNYTEKSYLFLKKLADCKNKNELEKKLDENIANKEKNNFETIPLLLEENIEQKNIHDNELLDDLYKIYCKFYKLSGNSLLEVLENKQKMKNLVKIKNLSESNELFKLFVKLSLYIPQFKLDINMDYNFYQDSKLIQNFNRNFSKKSNNHEDKEQILYTKSILYELLSTELVSDYGFITNLNFNYLTNINMDNKNKNNPIQDAIFKQVDDVEKTDSKYNEMIYSDNDNPNIKLIWKYKNLIMKNIEEKFEQDDYLQLNKLESFFNTSLINAYYNYSNKIIMAKENNS